MISVKPKIIFLSWAENCSRSDAIAQELGGKSFLVYSPFWGSTYATILFKYSVQFYRTILILKRERADIAYVMTPPTIACLAVWCVCKVSGLKYVIDAHTGAFLLPPWSKLKFLHKFFSRAALATIVTNKKLADIVSDWGAKPVIVPDVPVTFPRVEKFDLQPGCCMAYINTFTVDEPLDLLLAAAKRVPEVTIYVTGDTSACSKEIIRGAPANVIFTGFLSRASYAGLVLGCQSVICLTKLDYTMQRGAYEAIYLGKPVITSNFGVLRSNFPIGTVFVNNDVDSIAGGIEEMMRNSARYEAEARQLGVEKRHRWDTNRRKLQSL